MKRDEYIGIGPDGFPFNKIYPPNAKKGRTSYDGYATNTEDVIFNQFAVYGYDVSFDYNGKTYYLMFEPDHVALSDENFTEEYEVFSDPIDLIRNLKIDGKPLLSIMDKIQDAEQW